MFADDEFKEEALQPDRPTQKNRWLRWLGAALIWSALAIALQVALGTV